MKKIEDMTGAEFMHNDLAPEKIFVPSDSIQKSEQFGYTHGYWKDFVDGGWEVDGPGQFVSYIPLIKMQEACNIIRDLIQHQNTKESVLSVNKAKKFLRDYKNSLDPMYKDE